MKSGCHCQDEKPCAAQIGIFRHLDEESLRKISSIAVQRRYGKGEILFSPEKRGGLFLISEGKVKIYELSPSGKEQLLRVLGKGDFAGEEALFSCRESFSFGEAITGVRACFIRREDFMDLLMHYPSISLKLLEEFSDRMRWADHQAAANTTESVQERLQTYLTELSKAKDSRQFELPMSMKELAAFLSTTPETLSRRMKALEAQGFLKRSGRKILLLSNQPIHLGELR